MGSALTSGIIPKGESNCTIYLAKAISIIEYITSNNIHHYVNGQQQDQACITYAHLHCTEGV